MASVAICTAVSKPNVTSVPDRSLSMVLGTPTALTPWPPRRSATPNVSSPPTATRASTPWARRLARTRSGPSCILKGLVRDVPRIVPPCARMSRHRGTSSSTNSSSSTPFQPSMYPITSSSWRSTAVSTTARITALSPGQSPPPVRIPMRIRAAGLVLAQPGLVDSGANELEGRGEDAQRLPPRWYEAADAGDAEIPGEKGPAVARHPRVGQLDEAVAPRGVTFVGGRGGHALEGPEDVGHVGER